VGVGTVRRMPDADPRTRPPENAGERETLNGVLDFMRQTVVLKVAGLTDEQAFSAPVPPSTLTPAGLVKHLTGVERFWFSIDFAGSDLPYPWPEDDPHGAFPIEPGDTLDTLVEAYLRECDRSRAVVAAAQFDDVAKAPPFDPFNLRYAVTHLIEETARHLGHLDLLVERIDGRTGE
jgi:hypothetical protein